MRKFKNEYKELYIYGLIDPRNNRVRYVGWCISLEKRLMAHLRLSCLKKKTHKNDWIKLLLSLKMSPTIKLLEVVDTLNYHEMEKKWIKFYGRENLTNGTDGGDGQLGHHPSLETRKKMGEARRGKNNPNFGKTFSDEYRKKLSEAHKGQISGMKGKHLSEETKNKISLSLSGENHPNYGKHLSKETCKKISESNKGRILSEEIKEKISIAHKGKSLSEEHKKSISQSLKGIRITSKETVLQIKILLNNNVSAKNISKIVCVSIPIVYKVKNGGYNDIYDL